MFHRFTRLNAFHSCTCLIKLTTFCLPEDSILIFRLKNHFSHITQVGKAKYYYLNEFITKVNLAANKRCSGLMLTFLRNMNAIPFLFQYMSCAYSDKGLYHHNMYEIRYTCTSVLSQETRTFLTKNSNQNSGGKNTQN